MSEIKPPRNRSLKNCACRQFYAEEIIDGQPRTYDTGCTRLTHNDFAQGHDAKLVSFLVKADVTGDTIRLYANDEIVGSAEAAAAMVSQALQAKAERAVRNALDKIAARVGGRADKVQAEARKAAAPKAETPVRGKVGRWEYEGTAHRDGSFTYLHKATGEIRKVESGKWTRVS